MKKRALFFITLMFFSLIGLADSTSLEHAIWDKTPIDIVLPVGRERMITFSESVQFGYDDQKLSHDILKVQNNDGTLYLTAIHSFHPSRVMVRLLHSNKIILLNLSASGNGDINPLQVVLPADEKSELTTLPSEKEVNAIFLLRFAENQLFAKKRYLLEDPRIFLTPMRTSKTVPLLLDGTVLSTPIRSWRGGIYFVTAVTLHNVTNRPVSLNPKTLCGDWKMTAFFPFNKLSPENSYHDTTTAFLLSTVPFSAAIGSCVGEGV